jgi:mono/diheme cytochrome c family protein
VRRIRWLGRNKLAGLGLCGLLVGGLAVLATLVSNTHAEGNWRSGFGRKNTAAAPGSCDDGTWVSGGTWTWVRSPDEEKRHVMGLYVRYCVRCHGVNGHGVWDIPDVPNFTNVRWQASRSDAQLARIIIEGRGAVMPPFRGAINQEEAWALARYLRTFVPGTEVTRPDLTDPVKPMQQPVQQPGGAAPPK